MRTNVACVFLSAFLIASVAGQTTPSSLSLASTYALGSGGGVGGMAFDATGSTFYVADLTGGGIQAYPVLRSGGPNGPVTGFGTPTLLTFSPSIDSGLAQAANGTWLWTTWPGNSLGQITSGSVLALTSLTAAGVPSSTGGLTIVPAGLPNAGEVWVSSYSAGGIYKVTLTPNANGTFTPVAASAVLLTSTAAGPEGIAHIPSGPYAGHLLSANYNNSQIRVFWTDPTTGYPTGQSAVIITGISYPMGLAFDPVTNQLFVSKYTGPTNVFQFAGTILGDFQTNQPRAFLDVNGVQGSLLSPAHVIVTPGQNVTVNWGGTALGNPYDIVLSFVPLVPTAFVTPLGQIVNINLASPFVFAFGGSFTTSLAPFSATFGALAGTLSAQMVVIDPATPGGLVLTQAIQIDA